MKTVTKVLCSAALAAGLVLAGSYQPAHAGFLDDIINHAKEHAKDKSKDKANKESDKAIDGALDGKAQDRSKDEADAGKDGKGYVVTDERGKKVSFPLGKLSFADRVVEYNQIKGVPDYAANPNEALGSPDIDSATNDDRNYVSLGNHGSLTVQFTDNYLVDVKGDDLWIFEIGPEVEPTDVAISKDGENWIHVGRVKGATAGVDIGPFVQPGERFSYVKLLDANARKSPDGADIDAVGAIGSVVRTEDDNNANTNANAGANSETTPATAPDNGGYGNGNGDYGNGVIPYTVKDSRGKEVLFPLGVLSFADRVVDYHKARGVPDYASAPKEALGPPNYTSSHSDDNYVSIGNHGSLTVQFVDNYLVDVDGDDLWIFEIGPEVEPTDVAISKDGEKWIHVGRVKGGTAGIDIGPKVQPGDRFTYVKLIDANARKSPDGADIDAVGAIGAEVRSDVSNDDGTAMSDNAGQPLGGTTDTGTVLEIDLNEGGSYTIPINTIKVITPVPKRNNGDCFNLQIDLTNGTSLLIDLSSVKRMVTVSPQYRQ